MRETRSGHRSMRVVSLGSLGRNYVVARVACISTFLVPRCMEATQSTSMLATYALEMVPLMRLGFQ
jgi:hypothetical protein